MFTWIAVCNLLEKMNSSKPVVTSIQASITFKEIQQAKTEGL